MKQRRDGAVPAPPAPSPLPAGAELRGTLLLPLLLERFDPDQPLTVLDLGYGVSETVAFFSRYTCRLHFAGIIGAPELGTLPEEDVDAYLDEAFTRLLDFRADARFDVCLLWDFLNYLSVPALRSFSRVLRPHLHRQTHGHGFGSFKASAPAMARGAAETALQYGVYDVDKLLVRPLSDRSAPGHSHSRAALADSLGCFEVVRGTLLKEGTMELLLQAR